MSEPRNAGWDCHVHVFDAQAPVSPGHYGPRHKPLGEIEAVAASQGIGHLVLVQPSVYGHDHRVLLQALAQQPGRHRGVAVVPPDIGSAELDRLHAAGMRGIRYNRVSPAGHRGDPGTELRRLAPALRERGWHVQCYVQAVELPAVVDWQAGSGLPFVLDHLGGLHAALPADDPAWSAATALAAAGAWVKLSGWYRLGAQAPYLAIDAALQRVLALFGPRCIWGSDWPHTGIGPERQPRYGDLLSPLQRALGAAATRCVLGAQARSLYTPDRTTP